MRFDAFLKRFDSALYDEYNAERLGGKYGLRRNEKKQVEIPKSESVERFALKVKNHVVLDKLIPFEEMPSQWKQYLEDRKIPEDALKKYFYYTKQFKRFTNSLVSGKFSRDSLKYEEERIVIVFYDEAGNITGFQGRETTDSYAKYVTIKFDDDGSKVFGRDKVDTSKDVFVVEGPIDSMFVYNCLGACGGDLVSQTEDVDDAIYVFDNEPRKKEIVDKISRAISMNKRVVIFPSHIRQKDINDMVLDGINVNELLKKNVYRGLQATLKFSTWRKC